jgi:hypothetical protein
VLSELLAQVRLIVETALQRDLTQGRAAFDHQLRGELDPAA